MLPTATTQQLITSGILEAYLLGMATEDEQYAIRGMMAQHPETFVHLNQLDADLQAHFQQVSVPPPPAIRDLIELRTTEPQLPKKAHDRYDDGNRQTGYQDTAHKPSYVDVEVDETHIRVHKNWRPAFVAIFVLSKVFLIASLYFYFKADSQAQEINRLKAEINQTTRK